MPLNLHLETILRMIGLIYILRRRDYYVVGIVVATGIYI